MKGCCETELSENVKEFSTLSKDDQELLIAAFNSRKCSHVPYSKYATGAALRMSNNEIFTGCEIENFAYCASMCAERTACCIAVSEGQKEIKALAIVTERCSKFKTPCGVCRQFLYEFSKDDFPIYTARGNPTTIEEMKEILCTSMLQLLPKGFRNYK